MFSDSEIAKLAPQMELPDYSNCRHVRLRRDGHDMRTDKQVWKCEMCGKRYVEGRGNLFSRQRLPDDGRSILHCYRQGIGHKKAAVITGYSPQLILKWYQGLRASRKV